MLLAVKSYFLYVLEFEEVNFVCGQVSVARVIRTRASQFLGFLKLLFFVFYSMS